MVRRFDINILYTESEAVDNVAVANREYGIPVAETENGVPFAA
eukprot:gene3078-1098_t